MKKEITVSELNEIQHCLDRIYSILGLNVRVATQEYKAMGKAQLAAAAGVTPRVLYSWMNTAPHYDRLKEMGIDVYSKILHPRAVAYVCEEFGIVL